MSPGACATDMRRRLSRRRHSAVLMHRVAHILRDGHALRFEVSDETHEAWLTGDIYAMAKLERQIDTVAERYNRTTMAVTRDGTILYQRMLVAHPGDE